MSNISDYLKYLTSKLKLKDAILYFSGLAILFCFVSWKNGVITTSVTFFTFFSSLVVIQFIAGSQFIFNKSKKKSSIEKGFIYLSTILLTLVTIVHLLLWDRHVTVYSIVIGVIIGVAIKLMTKAR